MEAEELGLGGVHRILTTAAFVHDS
jgi:hypothetical protein